MTKTVLFVDEEKYIHKALQRSFRGMRDEWEMRFAECPAEAARILAHEPVDVLVTEMIFGGQSGMAFLSAVRTAYPHIVRIILSATVDRNVILKTIDIAHQFLSKPCDDGDLKSTIDRAFLMKGLLDQDSLKSIVTHIDALPSLPALYQELVAELRSEEASIQSISDIVIKDLGLSTKLLKLVNSAFFGLPRQITHPAKAVALLGTDLVSSIVLASGTFDQFKHLKYKGFSIELLWDHAMVSGAMAKMIARQIGLDRMQIDTAFISGMLHDTGKLLVAAFLPDHFRAVLQYMRIHDSTMAAAERDILGTTHAPIGAYLLGLWGLPESIINAAAFHHDPAAAPSEGDVTGAITHVASAFANAGTALGQLERVLDDLDYSYLAAAGLLDRLPQWRTMCAAHLPDGNGLQST